MAGGARQTSLRFRRVDLLADRAVEASVEKYRVIVAAGTPFRRLRAHHILHVLDRFAVPLIVERREVVRRRAPLLVDVAMAPPAALAGHEERGRDEAVDVRVRRRWKERARLASAFAVHRRGCRYRIFNTIRRPPPRLAAATPDGRRACRH